MRRFRAGQFRLLAEREDESGMVVVAKGTIKRMAGQDVDERGQPYDLILPESSLKGNSRKKEVTDEVLVDHLRGRITFGWYCLDRGNQIK